MSTITLTIPGDRLPIRFPARIIEGSEARTARYSEITGPPVAFDLIEGNQYDKVKVNRPDLVEIKTFQVL